MTPIATPDSSRGVTNQRLHASTDRVTISTTSRLFTRSASPYDDAKSSWSEPTSCAPRSAPATAVTENAPSATGVNLLISMRPCSLRQPPGGRWKASARIPPPQSAAAPTCAVSKITPHTRGLAAAACPAAASTTNAPPTRDGERPGDRRADPPERGTPTGESAEQQEPDREDQGEVLDRASDRDRQVRYPWRGREPCGSGPNCYANSELEGSRERVAVQQADGPPRDQIDATGIPRQSDGDLFDTGRPAGR